MYNFKERKKKQNNNNQEKNETDNNNLITYKSILNKISIIETKPIIKEENKIKLIAPPTLDKYVNKENFSWKSVKDKITYFEELSYF